MMIRDFATRPDRLSFAAPRPRRAAARAIAALVAFAIHGAATAPALAEDPATAAGAKATRLGSLEPDGPVEGLRFLVDADGMRSIGAAQLAAAGVALPIDSAPIRLFDHERELPILVNDGGDGRIDPNSADEIQFYAYYPRGAHTTRPAYNDAAPHWLIVDAAAAEGFAKDRAAGAEVAPPRRMELVGPDAAKGRFPETIRYDYHRPTTRHERDYMYATWLDADPALSDFYFYGNVGATNPDVALAFWIPRPFDPAALPPEYEEGFGAELAIKLYGISRAKVEGQNDHVVDVSLNGNALGRIAWDGVEPIEWRAAVDPAFLLLGKQQEVKLTVPEDRLFAVDEMYVDWVELAAATSIAGAKEIFPAAWKNPEGRPFHIVCANRPTAEERLIDPVGGFAYQPVYSKPQNEEATLHRLEFRAAPIDASKAPGRDGAKYVLVGPPDVAPVPNEQLRPWRPLPALSELASLATSPASVVVTNGVLWDPASRLADRRQAEGLDTLLVDVYDVYDHYSNGLVSEEAVYLFLKSLWEASPLDPDAAGNEEEPAEGEPRPKSLEQPMRKLRYLTLFGDSTYDYKGIQAKYHPERLIADSNLLPISYTDTRQAQRLNRSMFPADNNYAALREGDHATPVVAVGRIPAATIDEAEAYLGKLEEYEAATTDDAWAGRSLLVSSWERSFQGLLDRIAKESLAGFDNKFLVAQLDSYENDVANLSGGLNEGCGVLYYVGHGGSFVWRVGPIDMQQQKDLFTGRDVRELKNEGRYPVVFVSSCYTVSFDHARSLGEEFVLTPKKGAVAVMGSPWKTGVTPNHNFNQAAASYMFEPARRAEMFPPPPDPGRLRLGDAFLATKLLRSTDHQSRVNFTLLGDPTLRVHIPPSRPAPEAATEPEPGRDSQLELETGTEPSPKSAAAANDGEAETPTTPG